MKQNGFTLVELLVSLMIFGMLSAAGVALLSFSVKAQETAATRLDGLSGLRRTRALLAADLAQAAPRLYRDETGSPRPAFLGAPAALALVRRGWENLDESRRPSLQRVEYRLAEGGLQRIAYPLVDGAAPLPPVTLLPSVERLTLRYRDSRGAWRPRWDPERPTDLPMAVELTVEAAGAPSTRLLFLTGPSA